MIQLSLVLCKPVTAMVHLHPASATAVVFSQNNSLLFILSLKVTNERNMRGMLRSLIKFLLHQHCLMFFTFVP